MFSFLKKRKQKKIKKEPTSTSTTTNNNKPSQKEHQPKPKKPLTPKRTKSKKVQFQRINKTPTRSTDASSIDPPILNNFDFFESFINRFADSIDVMCGYKCGKGCGHYHCGCGRHKEVLL